MYPGKTDQFLHKYEAAVERPYGYLFVDLKPNTPEECRLRTNVLPNDPPQTGGQLDVMKTIDCSQPLGVQDGSIPDNHITASGQYASYCAPYFARLHRQRQSLFDSSWCARYNKIGEFVQVNLGSIKTVTKVATQGRKPNADYKDYIEFVTMYTLSYSNDQATWTDYVGDDSCIKRFIVNTDTTSVVTNELPLPIKAQYIRVVAYSWNQHISMKLELYGC
ncbi:hypothetical protein QZH41_005000 [Actinostola sp. cb2023]|nr:hypothetical protein QZH41_005000 [Actinostola sp. cb2023]